jgi:hypothetical protein
MTSIAPEFEAPPAVTAPLPTPASKPDASVPEPASDTKTDKKGTPDGHPKKDPVTPTGDKKDAGTPKDPVKDAGTPPDPPKDAGTPKDPKTDPKTKDAGLPTGPSKECLDKCTASLKTCAGKLGPNGLPDIQACSNVFKSCQKACAK